jgi:hypothetical protein
MKKNILKGFVVICLAIIAQNNAVAQNVAINSTGAAPNASAMLDITSTSSGILIPRMTSAQRTAIATPATGLMVYDTNTNTFWYYNGTLWIQILNSSTGWSTTGNAGTVVGTNFLGTTDAVDFTIRTNNTERMRVLNTGQVAVNSITTFAASTLYSAASGNNNAVDGNAAGTGTAVYGQNTGTGSGVRGLTNNASGIGVGGFNIAAAGTGTGGLFAGQNTTAYTSATGSGLATNGNGLGMVAYGNTTASGWGVLAAGNNGAGATVAGGGGGAFQGTQWGVFGTTTTTNNAVDRAAFIGNYNYVGSTGSTVYVGARIGGTHYKILGTTAGSVSTTMPTRDGERILFAPEAPENWFFDIGEVVLVNGKATVELDPLFVDCLSDSKPFKVFVQGSENTLGSIKITRNQANYTFVVEDLGGASNGVVQYSIYGIWKTKENLRFPKYTTPEGSDVIQQQKVKVESPQTIEKK